MVSLIVFTAVGCAGRSSSPGGAFDGGGESGDAASADAEPSTRRCEDTDLDQDGFGTGELCDTRDCDDENISIHPGAPEACNGMDDDCDLEIDEELGIGACGEGVCRRTVPNCENGRPTTCIPAPPSAEVCNGLDDDCNGTIDDAVITTPCGLGACEAFPTCVAGALGACAPGAPSPERCNRIDDDCNGTIDDGFRASYVGTTYTTLRAFAPGCDGTAERLGVSCNAAIDRFCAGEGCTTSGFGPLENSGDNLAAGCVVAAPARKVSYDLLSAHHAGCEGTLTRIGPECSAAIHRYCRSEGFATGFGPVEVQMRIARVVCLEASTAVVLETSYSELSQRHGGCTGSGTQGRWGPDCNAAINRFCAAGGYTTGYGPVENVDDRAVIVCVSP